MYDRTVLRKLLDTIKKDGRETPALNLKYISWHTPSKTWRVYFPDALGGAQHYFGPCNHGGVEKALIEALYFRDDKLMKAGENPTYCTNITRRRLKDKNDLPINIQYNARRNFYYVRGAWMETRNGVLKQRTCTRTISPRTEEQAWAEVEAIVRAGVEREAANRRPW